MQRLNPILQTLSEMEIKPVLLDVGATGGAPALWDRIAAHSTYVGFDPDEREMRDGDFGPFARTIILNAAVTDDPTITQVCFYLTRAPQCSSTLPPDDASLSQYLFSDSFVVERETSAAAVTLSVALDHAGLSRVDWIKLDTQGTDLRLFQSLPEPVHTGVLAVDLEPGLIHAYRGEDLFVDTHQAMLDDGFWLSNMAVRGTVRMQRATRKSLPEIHARLNETIVGRAVRLSPAWVEARYFRTAESLGARQAPPRDYALLWVFALLDGQPGFALDLALAYRLAFGDDQTARAMHLEPARQIEAAARRLRLRQTALIPLRLLRRMQRRWKQS